MRGKALRRWFSKGAIPDSLSVDGEGEAEAERTRSHSTATSPRHTRSPSVYYRYSPTPPAHANSLEAPRPPRPGFPSPSLLPVVLVASTPPLCPSSRTLPLSKSNLFRLAWDQWLGITNSYGDYKAS